MNPIKLLSVISKAVAKVAAPRHSFVRFYGVQPGNITQLSVQNHRIGRSTIDQIIDSLELDLEDGRDEFTHPVIAGGDRPGVFCPCLGAAELSIRSAEVCQRFVVGGDHPAVAGDHGFVGLEAE